MHIDKKLMHRIFILIAGAIVFGWLVLDTSRASALFQRIWELFSPFVIGAGIAFIFNVPMRSIENQLEGVSKQSVRRTVSMLLTIFALVLVVMFVFELLIPQIRETVLALTEKIPAFIDRTAVQLMAVIEENPDLGIWIQETFDLESLNWTNIVGDMLKWVADQISTVMGGAVNVIGSVTTGLVNLVISVVFALYCLANKETLARQGRRLVYSLLPEHRADQIIRVMRLTNVTFSNFISGQCLESVILGCLFAVVMAIFKMPYIPLVSVIIAMTALIPVVGAFVGCIVGAFFILVNDPLQALSFIAMFLVIQQLENNLIYPRVVGTSIGLPGMWVLVSVTIGGEIMGVGGMLVMIPLVSVLYTLAREFTAKRLVERNIPEEKLQAQPMIIKSRYQQKQDRKERQRLQKLRKKIQELQVQQKKK